jgi:glyoxalase family protein
LSKDPSLITGLHHITLVTGNQEVNRRFYTEMLGLRRVKLSVNQDDPFHRHLFYADDAAKGTAITFFEWPDLPRGAVGLGSPHHLSYQVQSLDSLSKWKGWLASKDVPTEGYFLRDGRISLYLRDPDGVLIELAVHDGEGVTEDYLKEMPVPTVREISSEMKLFNFDHASPISHDHGATSKFLENALHLTTSFDKPNPDDHGASVTGIGNDVRPDFLRYLSATDAHRGYVGIGNIHHIAMAVDTDDDQKQVLKTLESAGIRNSGVIDRFWFHSVYFRDPDGNLLEVATKTPGYTVDEDKSELGSKLVLPSWLEPQRPEIQLALDEEDKSNHASWPPKSYPAIPKPPEKLNVEIG